MSDRHTLSDAARGRAGLTYTRRDLLRTSLLLAAAGLAAACQSAPAPATPAPKAPAAPAPAGGAPAAASPAASPAVQASPAAAAGPAAPAASAAAQRGGTLQIAIAQDVAGFDPHMNISLSTIMAVGSVYNNLVRLDGETGQKLVGDLAEKWSVSPDGKTFTFTLRGGTIKWHDGQPFTIDDVLFSLKKMGDNANGKVASMADTMNKIASARAVDPKTLEIVLKQPSGDFLWELAEDYAKILPKHVADAGGDLNKTPIGTGPFKLNEYKAGAYIDLVKNPDYAVEPGLPYLDGIRLNVVPDRATQLAGLATGRIDTLGRAGPEWMSVDEVNQVQKQNPAVQKLEVPDLLIMVLMMNTRKPPFNDVRVRKAAFLAIDRKLAIDVIGKGAGLLPGIFPVGWGLSQDELAQLPGYRQTRDQDLAEAKQLLKDAGFGNGLPFTMNSRIQPSTLEAAQFIAQQISNVGFKPTIKTLEDGPFFADGTKGDFDAMVFTPASALPIDQNGKFVGPKGRFSNTGLAEDPKYVEIWTKQSTEIDETKRKDQLKQLERLWLTEYFGIAGATWKRTYLCASPRMQNFTSPAMSIGGLLFDKVWLKQ